MSTTDHDLTIQDTALRGCEVIGAEKRSGTTTEAGRSLRTVLDFLRPGDVLMVTRVDRLARSIADLRDIVRSFKTRGASPESNRTADRYRHGGGKVLLRYAWGLQRIRDEPASRAQVEGMAKAGAAGVYKDALR